jgi:hypothetical protein
MWESRLSGSERGRRTTGVWKRYCGTAAKAGGKQRKQTSSCSHGRLLPTRKAGSLEARKLESIKIECCEVRKLSSLPASQRSSIF